MREWVDKGGRVDKHEWADKGGRVDKHESWADKSGEYTSKSGQTRVMKGVDRQVSRQQ